MTGDERAGRLRVGGWLTPPQRDEDDLPATGGYPGEDGGGYGDPRWDVPQPADRGDSAAAEWDRRHTGPAERGRHGSDPAERDARGSIMEPTVELRGAVPPGRGAKPDPLAGAPDTPEPPAGSGPAGRWGGLIPRQRSSRSPSRTGSGARHGRGRDEPEQRSSGTAGQPGVPPAAQFPAGADPLTAPLLAPGADPLTAPLLAPGADPLTAPLGPVPADRLGGTAPGMPGASPVRPYLDAGLHHDVVIEQAETQRLPMIAPGAGPTGPGGERPEHRRDQGRELPPVSVRGLPMFLAVLLAVGVLAILIIMAIPRGKPHKVGTAAPSVVESGVVPQLGPGFDPSIVPTGPYASGNPSADAASGNPSATGSGSPGARTIVGALGQSQMDAYCAAQGAGTSQLTKPAQGTDAAINNWACSSRRGKPRSFIIDPNQACQATFGSTTTAGYLDPNDAYSWRCYR